MVAQEYSFLDIGRPEKITASTTTCWNTFIRFPRNSIPCNQIGPKYLPIVYVFK